MFKFLKKKITLLSAIALSLPCLLGATLDQPFHIYPFKMGSLFKEGALDGVEILFELFDGYEFASTQYDLYCDIFSRTTYTTKTVKGKGRVTEFATIGKAVFNLDDALPVGDKGTMMFRFALSYKYSKVFKSKNFQVDLDRIGNNQIVVKSNKVVGKATHASVYEKNYSMTYTMLSPTYNFSSYSELGYARENGEIDLSIFNFTYSSGLGSSYLPKGAYEDIATLEIKGTKYKDFAFLGGTLSGDSLVNIPVKLVAVAGEDSISYGIAFPNKLAYEPNTRKMTYYTSLPPSGYVATNTLVAPLVEDGPTNLTITLVLDTQGVDNGDVIRYSHTVISNTKSIGSCEDSDFCVGVGL